MSVYKNNKNGTLDSIATNIQVINTPTEQFVSKVEFNAVTPNDVSAQNKLVAENEVVKAVSTMPTASVSLEGKIVQYVGVTNANYTNSVFYKCVSDGELVPSYSWEQVTIPHFSIMPTDAELFALPDNTVFEIDGYYDPTDGNGGKYLISANHGYAKNSGGLIITYNNQNRYLYALSDVSQTRKTYIDVCRYGIRPYPYNQDINLTTITAENSYATLNSSILKRFMHLANGVVFRFPRGRFVFEESINLKNTGNSDTAIQSYSIMGEGIPSNFTQVDYDEVDPETHEPTNPRQTQFTSRDVSNGTILLFPFLNTGDVAIQLYSDSCIQDCTIYGNINSYDFYIGRERMLGVDNPTLSTIVTEVNTKQCTGIYLRGNGHISNVCVSNFYLGVTQPNAANETINNLYINHCYVGAKVNSDCKIESMFGFNVNTLIYANGAIISLNHIRVDSCVHVLTCGKCEKLSVVDLDGDWCAEELIKVIDKSTSQNPYMGDVIAHPWIINSSFVNIHGRHSTLHYYINTDPIPNANDSDSRIGYGLIGVGIDGKFQDNYVECMSVKSHTFDSKVGSENYDKYWNPDIVLTRESTADTNVKRNIFMLVNDRFIDSSDVFKLFQPKSTVNSRVDTAIGTYYYNNTTVTQELQDATLKAVVAASSDFADFQTRIAAL